MPQVDGQSGTKAANVAPKRRTFATPAAKRAWEYRQRQKRIKRKKMKASGGGQKSTASSQPQPPVEPADYDSEDVSSSSDYEAMSDSNESKDMHERWKKHEQEKQDANRISPVPEGMYRPCDRTNPLGNPALSPQPKPALGCEVAANDGRRLFTKHEKALVHEELQKLASRETPDFAWLAARLQSRHREYFGAGTPRMPEGITRQQVRAIHLQGRPMDDGMSNMPGQGRHPALPESVVLAIIALLASVVKSKVCPARPSHASHPSHSPALNPPSPLQAINFTARMLQPLAVGVIIAQGFGSVLAEECGKGRFCAGLHFICDIMKQHRWKPVKPQGNSRKLPANWELLIHMCMLRLAYFVFVFAVPAALVVNADHTGLMFLQYKGRGWLPEEMWKAGEKGMQHLGDMRQMTLLASTSAAGDALPHQVVLEGKTAGSLPAVRGVEYKPTGTKGTYKSEMFHEKSSKCATQVVTRCFVPLGLPSFVAGIASFCVTHNHWSNHVTSMAYVKDIFVPYCCATIAKLRAADTSVCLPFGDQVCVLVVDCWWGWLDRRFRTWLHHNYAWCAPLPCPSHSRLSPSSLTTRPLCLAGSG